MKTRALHIVSAMMAILILFISTGWTVNFHYCTEDHQLVSSFGNASQLCEHCKNHPHQHMNDAEYHNHLETLHFDSKCCCEDFDSRIQFTDDYTFTPEKQIPIFPNAIIIPHLGMEDITQKILYLKNTLSPQKIPLYPSGREMTLFFSNLRLSPHIF